MTKTQNFAVLGLQWGDEGKGKIVNFLSPNFHATCRFQGGHNAGHTLIVNGKKLILHLLPSLSVKKMLFRLLAKVWFFHQMTYLRKYQKPILF